MAIRPKLTQAALARDVGVETMTISRYERDDLGISPGVLERIAARLGVSPAWLMYGDAGTTDPAGPPELGPQDAELVAAAARHKVDDRGLRILRALATQEGPLEPYEIDMLAAVLAMSARRSA